MYTSDCIEESRILRTLSHTESTYGSQSHSRNDADHAFDYQLDQWGVEKFFKNSDKAITRELKIYIEYCEILNIKNKSQLSCTTFLAKYVSLTVYDEDTEKRFIIDHDKLQSDKNVGWNLIGIPEKPDGTLFDHEYFFHS